MLNKTKYDELWDEIEKLDKEIDKLIEKRKKLYEEAEKLVKEAVREIKQTEKRGATILTRPDGKAISLTPKNMTHYERKVYEYDGRKRGKLIAEYDRGSVYSWKRWLALA